MQSQIASSIKITSKKKGIFSSPIIPLCVFCVKNTFYVYFLDKNDSLEDIAVATSQDGFEFARLKKNAHIATGKFTNVDMRKCSHLSVSEQDGYFNLLYTWNGGKRNLTEKAYTKDMFTWTYEGTIPAHISAGVIVPNTLYKNQQILFAPDNHLSLFLSKDFVTWEIKHKELLPDFHGTISSIDTPIPTEKGILLVFHAYQNNILHTYLALFDSETPHHLLWYTKEPIWTQLPSWKNPTPIGSVLYKKRLLSYYYVKGEGVFAAVLALHTITDTTLVKPVSLQLKRSHHNPMIVPNGKNSWEAFTTFNPAAIYDNGKVHLLYRAQGYDYVSSLGYASSSDGYHIDTRLEQPIFAPSQPFDTVEKTNGQPISFHYMSGGGYGGCEDPRITKIDNRFYLTYVAFDGYSPPRVALTSISQDNFLNHMWFWEKPVLISPPGVVDKSAVIFPEKINGKYVVMHRIYPDILIDFVDSLEFDGKTWLEGKYRISPRPNFWDSRKIGAGAPPIKTKYGWLLIYQSVGEQDPSRYKIGAMLLDLKDPKKVLYRSNGPILEPDAEYENNGFKAGVIYPCGAVVIMDTLFVYYGGADSYVCVATANLDEFLSELMYSEFAKLRTPIVEKIL